MEPEPAGPASSVEARARAAEEALLDARAALRRTRMLAALGLGLLVIAAGAAWEIGRARERERAETGAQVEAELRRSADLAARASVADDPLLWRDAVAAARGAVERLEEGAVDPRLELRARGALQAAQESAAAASRARDGRRANQELLEALEEVREPEAEPWTAADWDDLAQGYRSAFARSSLDPLADDLQPLALELWKRGITVELAPALDAWSAAAEGAGRREEAERLLGLARTIDPDPLRVELRTAVGARDVERLAALASDPRLAEAPPPTARLLGNALARAERPELALAVLRAAADRAPEDFALARDLARWLGRTGAAPGEALGFHRAALALRPESVEARHELGVALQAVRPTGGEAEGLFAAALALRPGDMHLVLHLAEEQAARGAGAEAAELLRQALLRAPDDAPLHVMLGRVLAGLADADGARREFRAALELDPGGASAHEDLALELLDRGDVAAAIEAGRAVVELAPDRPLARYHLGVALARAGRDAEAIEAYRETIRLDPTFAEAFYNLGNVLMASASPREAEAAFRQALALRPDFAEAHVNLGDCLHAQGRLEEAIAEVRAGHELGIQRGEAWTHPTLEILHALERELAAAPPGPRNP